MTQLSSLPRRFASFAFLLIFVMNKEKFFATFLSGRKPALNAARLMKRSGGIRRAAAHFRDITLLIWTNLIIFFCWFKPPSRETGRDVTCSGKMRLPSKANRLNERDWGLKSIMDYGGGRGGGVRRSWKRKMADLRLRWESPTSSRSCSIINF